MFSFSIVRPKPSSIVKPRCNSTGLRQLCTTAAATAAGTTGACKREGAAASRAVVIGQLRERSVHTATAGYVSRLALENGTTVSVIGHRNMSRSRRSLLRQARTFRVSATAVHAPGLKGGGKQPVRPAIVAPTNRFFAFAGKGPADTDTDSSESEGESEFDSTIFRTAGPQPKKPAGAGEEPPAKKKTSKGRKPRKRRTSSSENPPPESTAEAAETPTTPTAAEATTATKTPRARKPRKRRTAATGKGDSTYASSAKLAKGAPTAAAEEEGDSESGAGIPESRKAAFERARREGVAQRVQQGGGAPLDSGSSSSDSDSDSDEEGQDGGRGRSPSSWKEPAKPVRPEGFPAEGSANAAKRRTKQRTRAPQEQHPVLGHFVADLKYKRVYVTSIDALMQAPVWEKARTLRPTHAAEIFHAQKLAADKMEIKMIETGKIEAKGDMEKKAKGLPGVITLCQRPLLPLTKRQQKYTLSILDGQHRLGAMLLLAEEGLWDRSEQNVLVEVFDTKDDEEIAQLFLDINKAEPIELDLGQPQPGDAQKCADEVVLHLYNEFQPMFGGKRTRPPSLHAVTFKKNILRSGLIERHDLFAPELLLDYLLRVNEMLSERDMQMWEMMIGPEKGGYSTKKSLLTALKKAKRHGLWLGMELSWMLV